MTYGFRTRAEQAALYEKHLAGGPLAAPPGHSAHEHGLAVDVCEVTSEGHRTWDTSRPAWPWLWLACRNAPRLHSGHYFPAPDDDDDHIQSTQWYQVRSSLKASGKW